jgi:hypothetical protein
VKSGVSPNFSVVIEPEFIASPKDIRQQGGDLGG